MAELLFLLAFFAPPVVVVLMAGAYLTYVSGLSSNFLLQPAAQK